MKKRVMVAMNGSTESSVTAILLCEKQYEVCGVTMWLFGGQDMSLYDRNRLTFSKKDVENAKGLASHFSFHHYVFNLSSAFHSEVVSRFTEGYITGKTPNPCVYCNRYVKFGQLFKRAMVMGMDYLSTGNFARIQYDADRKRWLLLRAKDREADQSYILYFLGQQQLSKLLLPLGELSRQTVLDIGAEYEWVNNQKRDGEQVCFVRDGNYIGFLEETMGVHSKPGNFVDAKGNILGTHQGMIHYTVGQRKGIGLRFDTPQYVIEKNFLTNTITLGGKSDLNQDHLIAEDVNLIGVERLEQPTEVTVQLRYRGEDTPALITPLPDGRVEVLFKEPQKGIAPGQTAVFYQGEMVLGGGTIL